MLCEMDETESLAERFEQHRPQMRAVAYRMLGSVTEAADAVQNAWLRLSSSEADQIDNLGGWLTTVVARECLHMLRARQQRREDHLDDRLPEVVVTAGAGLDPEQEVLLADSVGLAMLIVLDTLTPAERLAFVLHDMFQLPFDEIARIVGRSPTAARQLASRGRRRLQRAEIPAQVVDVARHREVVEAFFAASRAGKFQALVKLLDPDVVLHADTGRGQPAGVYRGLAEVVKLVGARPGRELHPVLVNGRVGGLVTSNGQPLWVVAFTVAGGKIAEIYGIRPDRVRGLDAVLPAG